jgi:hypothetical protein
MFAQDNIEISGTSGKYYTQIYNHLDCKQQIQANINNQVGKEKVTLNTKRVDTC